MKIAVCGATGLVGQTVLELLAEPAWSTYDVLAFATERSAGSAVRRGVETLPVAAVPDEPPAGLDYAICALPGEVSRRIVPRWRDAGVRVVDKSSVFRMDPAVPLVVPGVNHDAVTGDVHLIATPNCTTIPVALALQPLLALGTIRDVRVSSYQAVSGAGRDAVEAWMVEIGAAARRGYAINEPADNSPFAMPIHGNVIPLIGALDEDGHATEELKLMRELPKILGMDDLPVSCTSVRVPVMAGHGAAVEVGFDGPVDLEAVRDAWRQAPRTDLWEDPATPPTALDSAGRDDILIGRVRRAPGREDALLFWVLGDNLRVGAATNGLRIIERWMGC